MKRLTVIATAVIVVLVGVLTFNVAAQQPDTHDRTIMTFSAAVELPSMKLEPGTYVFRIADTASRNVIQVLSEDEMKVIGQWLFVPAERLEVTGDTVVTFRETDAKTTPAVQFWYYPGEKIGKEFIYPKDQAHRIAQRTGVAVLTDEGRVNAEGQIAEADKPEAAQEPATTSADSGIGVVEGSVPPEPAVEAKAEPAVEARAETQAAPAPAPRTAAPPAAAERPVGTSGQQEPTAAQSTRNELPATASPLALSGLLGLLSIIGAAGIRTFKL